MTEWRNGAYWSELFRGAFKEQIVFFCQIVETKLLPALAITEENIEQIIHLAGERMASYSDPDFIDEGDIADRAEQKGIEYAIAMDNSRQSIINLAAVALFHLLEQQFILFYRKECIASEMTGNIYFSTVKTQLKHLKKGKIDLEGFKSWGKVYELKEVANTVKHGKGNSATKVQQLRPELFTHPLLRNDPINIEAQNKQLLMTLAGEDFFLTLDDLREYCLAVQIFLDELSQAIDLCEV